MRAAEQLIAERGVENVSIRHIVNAAQQKNESALQYHFKTLSGLLDAIHAERAIEIQNKRARILETLLDTSPTPALRQLCELMVAPTFLLARSDTGFRRYVKAFGHLLALTESSPLQVISRQGGGGASGEQVGFLLRESLPHLDEDAFRRRLEASVMLCSASMYRQARQSNAFRGRQSDLFFHNLVDALTGLFSAPVSDEAKGLSQS